MYRLAHFGEWSGAAGALAHWTHTAAVLGGRGVAPRSLCTLTRQVANSVDGFRQALHWQAGASGGSVALLVVPPHMGSSWTRDQTHVPFIDECLINCATTKVPEVYLSHENPSGNRWHILLEMLDTSQKVLLFLPHNKVLLQPKFGTISLLKNVIIFILEILF